VLLWQILWLYLRNKVTMVFSKIILQQRSGLLKWYSEVEDRLSYEEYEDPNQCFYIEQYLPLYKKLKAVMIQKLLK